MVGDDLRARREALVLHHMEVEERGDAAAVVATFAVPRYDLVAPGVILEGAAAVTRRVEEMAATMPGVKVELVSLRHADDAVIVETCARGRHTAPLLGVEPTGRNYVSRGVAIFRFDGDLLVEEIVYYDRQSLIDQLTGKIQPELAR